MKQVNLFEVSLILSFIEVWSVYDLYEWYKTQMAFYEEEKMMSFLYVWI